MADVPVPTIPANINPVGFSTHDVNNHGWRVFIPLVVMVIVSGLTVTARISARVSARQLGADDCAIVLAMTSCVVQMTMWAKSVQTGYGADYLKLTTAQRQEFNKWWFFGNIFYPITLLFFKTSVILLSKRIFVQQGFQRVCWATLIVNTSWALGNIFSTIFQCYPIPIMWGVIPSTEGTCWGQKALWQSIVSWDVTSDLWIMGMSIPMIWKLRLRTKEKFALTLVFLLGAVDTLKLTGASVTLFSLLSCAAIAKGLPKQGHVKNHYTFALANLFQVLESNMGVIGACLPILKQPLQRIIPRLFATTKKSSSQNYYYSDDRYDDQYALRNVGQKREKDASWHSVSVSGPELFTKPKRHSDELHIIGEEEETDKGSPSSGFEKGGDGIRKNVVVSVDRASK